MFGFYYFCNVKVNRKTYIRLLFLWNLLALLPFSLQANSEESKCPVVKIVPEQLAGLNIPRSGHTVFIAHGEVTVIGGHTSGFIPTPTAEYYKDGKWHLLQTVYEHDGGFSVVLKSGKVIIGGGFEKHLGIGQTFVVETYDPIYHTFEGFGCLQQKRVSARAIEMNGGQVIISGNWYADDTIEKYDGKETFTHFKDVSQQRTLPYIFRTSQDNALLFSAMDTHGKLFDTIVVDQLHGESFCPPLFETWKPLFHDMPFNCDNGFIGDESRNLYAYLFPIIDQDGQVAIAQVQDTIFSVLPTTFPVPMKSQWGAIKYNSPIIVNRKTQHAYLIGIDNTFRHYILSVKYGQEPAPMTLYYTDPIENAGGDMPILTEDGGILLTGGKNGMVSNGKVNNNFRPFATVLLLRLDKNAATQESSYSWLWFIPPVILLILLAGYLVFLRSSRKKKDTPQEAAPSPEEKTQTTANELLMQRICLLMEERKPFLNCELKVSDVATMLATNGRYISESIKVTRGTTFVAFINEYRVSYAQQLLRQQPDIKMTEVYIKSGFANETSFFRTFKAHTGMTPKEWLQTLPD